MGLSLLLVELFFLSLEFCIIFFNFYTMNSFLFSSKTIRFLNRLNMKRSVSCYYFFSICRYYYFNLKKKKIREGKKEKLINNGKKEKIAKKKKMIKKNRIGGRLTRILIDLPVPYNISNF